MCKVLVLLMTWLVWEEWLLGAGVVILTLAALYGLVRFLHCLVPDDDAEQVVRPPCRGEPPVCMCCNCGQYEAF